MHIAAIEDQEYKEEKINFWDDVYGFDYSCIKEIALREPLVDTVDLKSVVTEPCQIKYIDITTVKKEDLTFKADFAIKATRNDYVHAFLAWFDIEFACCHKPVKFSTGPHAKYTHWKVRLFHFLCSLTTLGRLNLQPFVSSAANRLLHARNHDRLRGPDH